MNQQYTTLVIQSFGRETEYNRAILTILSYYAHTSLPIEKTRVLLFTDKPMYFSAYLNNLPVDYVLLTASKIKQMRGNIDFLHRMKIALIEEAFESIEGPMLYADSDTFFIADPTPLMQQVSEEKAFMHLWEYRFESMRNLPLPAGETFRAFLNLIENNKFKLADGTQISVSPDQVSWNAGVMLFHPDHARFIPDVYALTDQFYPDTKNHAAEQYAFSIVLQNNTTLQPCDQVIYHYWYRVKKQIVDLFLAEQLSDAWSSLPLSQKLRKVEEWSKLLPDYFDKHILTIRDNAIQAFNDNHHIRGYVYALKAILQSPFDKAFLKDVIYHTKRRFSNK